MTATTPDGLLARLRELVEIESPTYSPGVRQVVERIARELGALGGDVRVLDGDHLRAEFEGRGRPLLLLGHADTVWDEGTLEEMPFRIEDGRAYGPGTYDMKGGLVLMLAAIAEARARAPRALRVFVTADEEMGSPNARPLVEEAAGGAAAALVLEPPTTSGDLKTARKGLGRFKLTVTGRPAHAGVPAEGANAVEELSHQVLRLQGLNERRGISVNVGIVSGGTTYNVVPAEAEALVDVRVEHAADEAELERLARQEDPEEKLLAQARQLLAEHDGDLSPGYLARKLRIGSQKAARIHQALIADEAAARSMGDD